jgi:hypothetical protein
MKAVVTLLAVLVCALPALADLTAPEMGPFKPNGMVAVFTDYGADSLDAGQLTGAALRKAPDTRVAVLSNTVPPFDVVTGAYLLANSFTAFPKGTVLACDVGGDPEAALVVIRTQTDHVLVAPDNGLLTLVAAIHGAVEVYEVTNDKLWQLSDVQTGKAQGRSICGAVAAALASGTPLSEAGKAFHQFQQLTLEPSRVEGGTAKGEVLFVDTFGNVVTNLREAHLRQLGIEAGKGALVKFGEQEATGLDCVAKPGEVPPGDRYIWANHLGFVTLGANGQSFAAAVGGAAHEAVTVEAMPEQETTGAADDAGQ